MTYVVFAPVKGLSGFLILLGACAGLPYSLTPQAQFHSCSPGQAFWSSCSWDVSVAKMPMPKSLFSARAEPCFSHPSSQTPDHTLSPSLDLYPTRPGGGQKSNGLFPQYLFTFGTLVSNLPSHSVKPRWLVPGVGTACLDTIDVSRSSPFRIPKRRPRPLLWQARYSWNADGEEQHGSSS